MPDEEQVHETVEQWTTRNKKIVRSLYGGFVGIGVIVVAYVFGRLLIADGDLTLVEAGFMGGLVIAGLIAAMPGTFMPLIHKGISMWQKRGGGE